MAVDCGAVDFMDGGTISNATITSSTVQGSVINGSAISASSLNTVTDVDDATAKVIASAIAGLPTEVLRELAKAIAEAMPVVAPTLGPDRTETDTLPTDIAGDRRYLLGAPAGWLEMRGVVVPAYKSRA